ncbi:MAG: rRNA pseudouridine synthase [Deltaproteobacteria bacterium]|nr:rRNA pseudouridine synthase [Deltaproteobacteria bacterium]
MALERLQKIVAQAGVASRRAAEELISAGRIRVNGRIVTELGAKADPRRDRIEVDGRRLAREKPVYIVLHKPRNVVSTLSDPEERPTVKDYVKSIDARLYPVGRLDYATSGVLLFTNDGDFTQALLHPKGKVPKTYVVKLDKTMPEEEIQRWREGIDLDDGKTLPADVRLIRYEAGKTWLEITLFEGRNNQIRRMADSRGYIVMRLARISFAGVEGTNLRPGQWRALTTDEQRLLKKAFGVPRSVRAQDELIGPTKKPPKPRPARRRDEE